MGNSGRGQRQPYRVLATRPPKGSQPERVFSSSSTSLANIDHEAREYARNGATCEILYVRDDGTFHRLFVYTPDNVAAFDEDAERASVYKPEDIIRWYRKHHGAPELLEGITARNLRTKKRPAPTGTPTDNVVPIQYPQDDDGGDDAPPLDDFRRPPSIQETTMSEQDQAQPTPTASPGTIELHFDVTGFPVVEAKDFKPVIAEVMEVSLYRRKDGTRYVGRIQLRGRAAKKDHTPANSLGNLWFNPGSRYADDNTPRWLLDFATEQCAPYLAPAAEEPPTEAPAAVAKRPATLADIRRALSYLLTGQEDSSEGPFAVHAADGFHDEPYVILPARSMGKILNEIAKERW
jgi:hypothetical protein